MLDEVGEFGDGDCVLGVAPTRAFQVVTELALGSNEIRIAITDPAGNDSALSLTVRRGSGRLRASISSTAYVIHQGDLPLDVRLTVLVDDPDGRPLAGARVTFTLSIPGIPTITGDATTDANGSAAFSTKIPKGASRGSGSAAVLVRTDEFGRTTDDTLITIKR